MQGVSNQESDWSTWHGKYIDCRIDIFIEMVFSILLLGSLSLFFHDEL